MVTSAPFRKSRGFFTGEDGTVALEFGLCAPFLILLVVGVIEFGSSAYQSMQAQNAAEAGAIYASKHGFDSAGISGAVANATQSGSITATPAPVMFCGCPSAGGVSDVNCTSTCTGGAAPGQYVRVSARIAHSPLISASGVAIPSAITGQAVVRIY